jgi:hypothetical protein
MRKSSLTISGILILLACCIVGFSQKTDKVFLKNGDVITGEIKKLYLAKLSFDMNGPGIISIKWEEVVRIRSNKIFQIYLQDGQVLLASPDSVFFETQKVKLDDIVEIVQIKEKFIKRLEGDINLGFSYTKSSDITQFNLTSSVMYRIPKVETTLNLNTNISKSSSDTAAAKKLDINISRLRLLKHRFVLISSLGWEQNTQLGLENRFLIAGGAGKIIFNDNHQRLLAGAGLSFNQEQQTKDKNNGYTSNLEAVAEIQYKKFRYSSPKISINADYKVFPSLTDWGRVRMNLQLNTSVEIFKDFNVGLTFYDNFDNRPSTEAASTNDYGVTFTVGYTFGK